MNAMRNNTWGRLLILGVLLLATSGCQKLKARDQLNKGVQAYKAARYQVAIEYFKTAVELDPALLNARLYLATAYANQYVPGAETEENLRMGEQAITEFQKVLDEEPNNVSSINGIANLYFQMKRMQEAKEFYKRQISLDPGNPEPYYSVGVIDWTQTYQPRMVLKSRLGLRPDEPFKKEEERNELAERNLPLIEEGMQMLNKAMELREDYDDAMAYLNLLYREKADVAETPEEREEYLKLADMWIEKTMEIKKVKAQQTRGG